MSTPNIFSRCVGAFATAGLGLSACGFARTKLRLRRFHFIYDNVKYAAFNIGLPRFLEDLSAKTRIASNCASVAFYDPHTTDLLSQIYPFFLKELQIDLAVKQFVAGLRDTTRDYLERERACRRIT